MSIAEKLTKVAENQQKVYDAGYQKGVSETDGYGVGVANGQALFGISNEVKCTGIVTCDYVNENEHNVEVKLSSDTVTDFSGREVKVLKKNLFDISKVENYGSTAQTGYIINNGDSITAIMSTLSNGIVSVSLKEVAPNLVIGETYTLSAITTGTSKFIRLIGSDSASIYFGNSFVLTEKMYNAHIAWYASGTGTECTISNIQIEKNIVETDYEPYTEKTYTANADGTVDGVTSISPTMNIICEGVDISAKYYCVPNVEWHRFWDNFQLYGKRTNYIDSFRFYVNDEIFKPKYDIVPTDSARMFSCAGGDAKYSITELKNVYPSGAIIDFSNSKYINQLFYYNASIKYIGTINATSALSLDDFVNNATSLVEIEKIILKADGSQRFSNAFVYAILLEKISFEGVIGQSINFQWSSLLSHDSIANIFNVLSSDVTDQTLTLSLTAVNNAFETAEGLADGSTSEEWLNLVATKPNWTNTLL